RHVIATGEALPAELAPRFHALLPGVRLHDYYGPTEATIWATTAACDPAARDARVPIGRPLANTQAYVLDAAGEPVPVGVPGEIHLGGACVARGYLDRPELERQRF